MTFDIGELDNSLEVLSQSYILHNKFTHIKTLDFYRTIEEKYKLHKIDRKLEKLKNNEEFISNNSRSNNLKELIFKAIDISDSLDDVIHELENQGIKTSIGRGISFTDKKGASFKGSAIDRKLSLSGIKNLLSYKEQEKRFNRGLSR